jgi:hypothetical protein
MIGRVWHGWTVPERADDYESLLRTQVFPGILAKGIKGFHRIELFRRPAGAEVEFLTVMWFEDVSAVRAFVGEDYETAYVPPVASAVLARFDARTQHYEVREIQTP